MVWSQFSSAGDLCSGDDILSISMTTEKTPSSDEMWLEALEKVRTLVLFCIVLEVNESHEHLPFCLFLSSKFIGLVGVHK